MLPTESDLLVDRAKAGDRQAVAELLDLYRNYLLLLARVHIDKNLQAKADASDLVQETCLMAARDFAQFRGETEAEFVAWLRRILANAGAALVRKYKGTRTRDIGREQQIQQQLDQSSCALAQLVVGPDSTPSRIAARRESAVVLANALARLPDDYREVVVLFHLEGLSLADVAARMGRSVPSVHGLRTRAILRLRTTLKELDE
jgi:RNA polymerase sigma-70 factor (ECF subfamily)